MLPSLTMLERISKKIKSIPNRQKESKRKVHYCLFLLGYKSGLRVSEAISFDLARKNRQGLYPIEKSKGKKERLVYIPKKVIRELRKHDWQPNSTNRFNFYHFLRKIKRELNINKNIELTPHTLRRSFTTYHAESGMPLPLLQKLLGHSSIRTTALYWRDIHGDNNLPDLLDSKKWLEDKTKIPIEPPITENFPKMPPSSKVPITDKKPIILHLNPLYMDNSLSVPKTIKKSLGMLSKPISPRTPQKFLPDTPTKKSDQLKITQPSVLIINEAQKPTKKELFLLQKIKHLERQLQKTTTERDNLKQLVQAEKQRANQAEQKLREISQQLAPEIYSAEQNTKTEAKIIQLLPWKSAK